MTKITPAHIHARARSSVGHFFEYLYPLLHPKRPIEMDWYIHAMSEAIMSLSRGETTAYHQCPSRSSKPISAPSSISALSGEGSQCRDHASYLRGRAHTCNCKQSKSLDAPSRLHASVSTHTLCWRGLARQAYAQAKVAKFTSHLCRAQ